MAHSATLIPGYESQDDTPLTTAVVRLLAATGVDIAWERVCLDASTCGDVVSSVKRHGRALMPYIPIDRARGDVPPIVELRRQLGVYANLRPVQSVAGLSPRHPDVDVMVVRETTEDIYANLEHASIEGVYESFKVTTEAACDRIARHAFELARAQGRKKVTIVHKANIMKKSDGLFLRVGQRVAQDFPDIAVEDVIVDALCMKLVLRPSEFDVLVCANLFGDIVADLCAGLVGGSDNCPSVNIADGVKVFTTGHGPSKALARGPEASVTSLLFAAVLLLRDLGESDAATRLMGATSDALAAGVRPPSAGGEAGAQAFADAVASRLA
ncbi:MAG: isocitrate/isopropylmalate family dehydrogenase [Myxococcota bacterium]